NDVFVSDGAAQFALLYHRLGADRGQVVAVEGDIQCAYRHRLPLDALDDLAQPRCQRYTPAADADENQVCGPVVLFDDFVGEPHQGALDFRRRHELRFLAQLGLGQGLGSHGRRIILGPCGTGKPCKTDAARPACASYKPGSLSRFEFTAFVEEVTWQSGSSSSARELSRAGVPVVVLEARDRIGGRVHTLHPPGLEAPVELGAEFVHGRPPEIWELAERGGLRLAKVEGDMWCHGESRLHPCDFFSEVERIM